MQGKRADGRELLKRQRFSYEAYVSGYAFEDIAEKAKTSVDTIRRDVRNYTARMKAEYQKKSAQDIFTELLFRVDQRKRGLLKIARDNKTAAMQKILAHRELREEDKHAVKMAQIMGILPNIADPQFFYQQNNTNVENKSVYQTILAIKHGELKADEELIREAEAKLCSPPQQ